jgi:Tfp pilus assembly protein PilO
MGSTTRIIVGMVVAVVMVVAFWQLELGPKRTEASELGETVTSLRSTLAVDRQELTTAIAARSEFSRGYQQLLVLGQGVPSNAETASLLVELGQLASRAGVQFENLVLEGGGSASPAAEVAPESPGGTPAASSAAGPAPVAPTEAAAASLPLGATVGSAGLAVMPYTLKVSGDFFHLAKFLHELNGLVRTKKAGISVDGRLLTVNSFSLAAGSGGFPNLDAELSVTTYVAPAGQAASIPEPVIESASTTATPASAAVGEMP